MTAPYISDTEVDQRLKLPSSVVCLLRDNIVWLKFDEGFDGEIDLPEAKDIVSGIIQLSRGKPVRVLADFRGAETVFTSGARQFFAHDEEYSKNRRALALVVGSLAQKITANFYKNYNKPDCPVRVFSDPSEALAWLRSLDQ